MPGASFTEFYGSSWEERALDLARYYGKHSWCRMVRAGLTVPQSLRDFLDGDTDMPDAQMALITTDSVNKNYRKGLSVSPDFVTADCKMNRLTSYVFAAYIGLIGVRYHWTESEMIDNSQFFIIQIQF